MNGFLPSLWTETLKMRRSKVPLLTALGFSIAPWVGGLFMVILKDPEAARSMGLISTKAQLVGGTADWTTCQRPACPANFACSNYRSQIYRHRSMDHSFESVHLSAGSCCRCAG